MKDYLIYDEIMKSMQHDEKEEWFNAMDKELEMLANMESFEIVDRQKDEKFLKSTWFFWQKRYPDGSFRKYKAHFCVREDLQKQGIDFFETYSPDVSWITIRILLLLSCWPNLKTAYVDYTLAFVQAPIENDKTCLKLPRRYKQEAKVLRLKRNVYGLRQAPLNFFNHLSHEFQDRGFQPSVFDPCLFINKEKKIIVLTYVHDCLIFAFDDKSIQDFIDSMKDNFLLDKEDELAGFLGIDIDDLVKRHFTLTQKGLINKIIKATGLEDANPMATPTVKGALGQDKDGQRCVEEWEYSSIVGMLMYLADN